MKHVTPNRIDELWKKGILPKLAQKLNITKVLTTKEQVEANTNPDNVPSAVVVGELINNLAQQPEWIKDSTGKITGYKTQAGADTVFPFSSFRYIESCSLVGWYDYNNKTYVVTPVRRVYDPDGIGDQKLLTGSGYYSTGWHLTISVSDKASGYSGLKGQSNGQTAATIAWL